MNLFSEAASIDTGTALKLIRQAHFKFLKEYPVSEHWRTIRNDLIELYKYKFSDSELKEVLKMSKM